MKKSWTIAALLATFAAGSASAAGTAAGTVITNQAEIIFTPEGSTTPNPPIPSNPVTTTVLPVPSFSITPNDESPDPTKPDYTKPGQTKTDVKPCDKNVAFKYVLTNTGNVPGESYTLANTPDPTGAVKTPENIRFYAGAADTNNDGTLSATEIAAATPITSITGVAQDQAVTFFQVYDIPCTATNTDVFGGDPTGTRNDNPAFNNDPTIPQDANNSNTTKITRNDAVVIGPKADPDGNGNPTTPPYTSPEGVQITPTASDTQVAQGTTTTTTVTFTNTLQNTGNRPDVINVTYNPVNLPAGSTVTLLKPDGTPLTDTNGDGIVDVGVVQPGATADVLVKVTFPAGSQPTSPTAPPTVEIVAVSSNDKTKSDPTKDIINLPGLSFGNPTTTPGGDPTQVGTPPVGTPTEFPNGSGNPTNPIIPPATCTGPIQTYLPMEVANLGTAPDLFNVSGTATVKLTSGSTTTVNVEYYRDVNGDGKLDAGDTRLTDTNGDGIADTGLLQPGTELKLVAVLGVPCDAASQTITLTQTAKSPTTSATVTDPNDTVTVGKTPVAAPTKSVNLAQARPGEELTYTIVGKNTSNANITKAMVCDVVPNNTTFVSFAATTDATGTVLYSNNGGSTWTTSASAPAAGQKVCAGVDTNGDGTITTADVLAPGKSITVTYKVKVN